LPADPLGESVGDVVDFHAALLPDRGQDPGHIPGGLQQAGNHLGLVGAEKAHAFPHVAGQHLLRGVQPGPAVQVAEGYPQPRDRRLLGQQLLGLLRRGTADAAPQPHVAGGGRPDALLDLRDLRRLAARGGSEAAAGQPRGQAQFAELAAQALPGGLEAGRRRRHHDQSKPAEATADTNCRNCLAARQSCYLW
jgi:hypothetical protein